MNDELDQRLSSMFSKRDQINKATINQAEIQMRIQDRDRSPSPAASRVPWFIAAGAAALVAVALVVTTRGDQRITTNDPAGVSPAQGNSADGVVPDGTNEQDAPDTSESVLTTTTEAGLSTTTGSAPLNTVPITTTVSPIAPTAEPEWQPKSDDPSFPTTAPNPLNLEEDQCRDLNADSQLADDYKLNGAQQEARHALFAAAVARDVDQLEAIFPARSVSIPVPAQVKTWEYFLQARPFLAQEIAQSLCEGSQVRLGTTHFPSWTGIAWDDLSNSQKDQLHIRDLGGDFDLIATYRQQSNPDDLFSEFSMMVVDMGNDGVVTAIYVL